MPPPAPVAAHQGARAHGPVEALRAGMLRAEVLVGDRENAALAGPASAEFYAGIALLYGEVLCDFGRGRGWWVDALEAASAAEAGG